MRKLIDSLSRQVIQGCVIIHDGDVIWSDLEDSLVCSLAQYIRIQDYTYIRNCYQWCFCPNVGVPLPGDGLKDPIENTHKRVESELDGNTVTGNSTEPDDDVSAHPTDGEENEPDDDAEEEEEEEEEEEGFFDEQGRDTRPVNAAPALTRPMASPTHTSANIHSTKSTHPGDNTSYSMGHKPPRSLTLREKLTNSVKKLINKTDNKTIPQKLQKQREEV